MLYDRERDDALDAAEIDRQEAFCGACDLLFDDEAEN